MDTFRDIEALLSGLERQSFDGLCARFRGLDKLRTHITGAIQFFAVDTTKQAPMTKGLPVVCTVGVNYTQGGRTEDQLFCYDKRGVARGTQSIPSVRAVIAAYNRNKTTWEKKPALNPESPLGVYGASDATRKTAGFRDGFILIMTNICPFITVKSWQKQPAAISERLLAESGSGHLDELFEILGERIDLWIGHSSIHGTRWVWPEFASFVRRHDIREWLLTANISGRSHLWFERDFRKPNHRLFPWYGPEVN